MGTKKKTVAKPATKKEVKTPKPTTLYTYVSPESKAWLADLCKKQVGKVSKSTMLEKILHGLRTKPDALKELAL